MRKAALVGHREGGHEGSFLQWYVLQGREASRKVCVPDRATRPVVPHGAGSSALELSASVLSGCTIACPGSPAARAGPAPPV